MNKAMKLLVIRDYRTRRFVGYAQDINGWCREVNSSYLPHHKSGNTWYVIEK